MGLSRTIYNNVLLAVNDIINSNCHFAGPVSHLAPCDVFTGCCKITRSSLLALDTVLSLLPRLLKQSTPASIQGTGPSFKHQAASLTGELGWYRMNLERKNYEKIKKRISTRRQQETGDPEQGCYVHTGPGVRYPER